MKSIKHIISCCVALALATTAFAQDFEPEYVGGYPTAETAERMFEEYDYQAAVQFYIWAYAYLNSPGWEKGCARMGREECSVPINFTVNQLLKVGKQPLQIGAGVRYWADSPDNGPEDWGFRLQLTFLFPK